MNLNYVVAMDIPNRARSYFCGWNDTLHNSWGGDTSRFGGDVRHFASQEEANQIAFELRGSGTGGGVVSIQPAELQTIVGKNGEPVAALRVMRVSGRAVFFEDTVYGFDYGISIMPVESPETVIDRVMAQRYSDCTKLDGDFEMLRLSMKQEGHWSL